MNKVVRTSPASHSRSGNTTAEGTRKPGISLRIRWVTASMSACAASRVMPRRSRPMTSAPPIPPPPGLWRAAMGIQTSRGPKVGKCTSGGRTPITVNWRSLSLIACPNTLGLAANSRCQNALSSSATLSRPSCSSSRVNSRPTEGRTPMSVKKSALTWATGISRAPPVARRILVDVSAPARRSKHSWRSRHSTYRESMGLYGLLSDAARMVMTRPDSGK